jgi:hypothetical protein
MEVAVADPAPILEIDPQFERRLGGGHKVGFVDPETLIETANVRQCRLTDSDDPDLLRLDQIDRAPAGKQRSQRSGSHPAGGTAANHDNPSLWYR